MAFAVDNGPVQLWRPGDPVPPEFVEAAANPAWAVVHTTTLSKPPLSSTYWRRGTAFRSFRSSGTAAPWRCAGAWAAGEAGRVADALELANRKDAAGERLMHQMSRPRKPRKGEDPAGAYWFDDQERLDRLSGYCKQDMETARELYYRLPPLSAVEQAVWALSGRINERGFHVDRQFAEAARRIAQAAAPEIDAELAELTGGAVTGINQIARMLQWLQEQGCTVRRLIARQLRSCSNKRRSACSRCAACSNSGSVAPRPPSRRSTHCLPAPATTIAYVAPSDIMAPPPAAGLEKVSSRKT